MNGDGVIFCFICMRYCYYCVKNAELYNLISNCAFYFGYFQK